MAKKSSILLEADPGDPEDFPVDRAALDCAQMGRRIRRLRNRLGLHPGRLWPSDTASR